MRFSGYLLIKEAIVNALKEELKHERLTNRRLRAELESSRSYLNSLREMLNEGTRNSDDSGPDGDTATANSDSRDS